MLLSDAEKMPTKKKKNPLSLQGMHSLQHPSPFKINTVILQLVLHGSVLLFIISINDEKSTLSNRKITSLSSFLFLSYFCAEGETHSNFFMTLTTGILDIGFVKP